MSSSLLQKGGAYHSFNPYAYLFTILGLGKSQICIFCIVLQFWKMSFSISPAIFHYMFLNCMYNSWSYHLLLQFLQFFGYISLSTRTMTLECSLCTFISKNYLNLFLFRSRMILGWILVTDDSGTFILSGAFLLLQKYVSWFFINFFFIVQFF